MNEIASLFLELKSQELFKEWNKHHAKAYLTHFFSAMSSGKEPTTSWEIGLYDPQSGKITVFVKLKEDFAIKPEDDVFKQETTTIEELDVEKARLSCNEALDIFKERKEEFFPKEVCGDGFVVLQTLDQKVLWNFTFITKTLKFVNLKINAQSAEVEGNQTIDLVLK